MRSFFEMGFRNPQSVRRLGQLDFLPTLISAGLQAGASVYGAHMNQTIAEMQKKTQEDIANKQAAAAQAQQQQQQQATTVAVQQQQTAAASPKIMGVDQSTFIMVGVGLALVVGVVAIVGSSSSGTPLQTVVAQ